MYNDHHEAMNAWLTEHEKLYPKSSRPGQTAPVVMAAITWAIAHNVPAPIAWQALATRDYGVPPRKRRVIWSNCQRHVAATRAHDATGALRLRLARRLVGRVLSPIDPAIVRAGSTPQLRRAFAVLVGQQMDTGYTLVAASPDRLAITLGVTQRSAQTLIKRLVEAGWLRYVKRLPVGTKLYTVTQLDSAGAAAAETNAETVDSIANATGLTPLAELLLGADHPAWGYAAPSQRAWLVAVCDAAGLRRAGDPYAKALGARPIAAEVRAARAFAAGDLDEAAVRAGAHETIAERSAEVEAAWAADRSRRANMAARKKLRGAARKAMLLHAGKLGVSSSEGMKAWAGHLRAGLQGDALSPDVLAVVAELVALDLVAQGMDAERAAEVGRRVVA